jgi:MFS transporter, OFA family, oxalate/formate antiporter
MLKMDNSRGSIIFYGWFIAMVVFMANFMATGTGFYVFNAFMKPLVAERGWTYTQVNMTLMIGPAIGLVSQLIFGTLVVKHGPRIIMTFGPLVSGVSFIMLGRTEGLLGFYAFYILLCLGNGAMSGIVGSTVVNNWFIKKRGAAMGFATAGISLSGVILPIIALAILENSGLAAAYQWIGCGILIMCPVSLLVIRDWPEKYGLRPDGEAIEVNGTDNESLVNGMQPPDIKLSSLIKLQSYWNIGFAYGLILIGVAGLMSQLSIRFEHMDYKPEKAMMMMGATALMGTFGKFAWGFLCDHIHPKKVVAMLMVFGGIGLGFVLIRGSNIATVTFILVFGFSMGGVLSTFPIIIAHYFGRHNFPAVAKFLAPFIVIQGVGPLLMGKCLDIKGEYDIAIVYFIVLSFYAGFLIRMIKDDKTELNWSNRS